MKKQFHKLMLITYRNTAPLDEYFEFIKSCATSGITSLQLREKNTSDKNLLEFGRTLKEILEPYNIALIINDSIDLARKLDADGVHLGQSDGDPKKARKILGVKKIIGVSIDSYENLITANRLPIDYVGISSIFATLHKTNVSKIWGIKGLRQISPLSKHPLVAIGGINESNVSDVMLAGADGIAVIGALHTAADPALTTTRLRKIIETRGKNYAY